MRARFIFLPVLTMTAVTLLWSTYAKSYFDISKNKSTDRMNGIALLDLGDFVNQWHLVTTRFRDDSQEMRFVYANDKAWNGMKTLQPVYADGAAFAKVAFASEPDPGFISSRVPGVVRRYQVMMRDQTRFKDSGGWGYALFSENGKADFDDSRKDTQACFSCHEMVKERNYVFSRPMFSGSAMKPKNVTVGDLSGIHFRDIKLAEMALPKDVFAQLGGNDPKGASVGVESLEGNIKTNSFSGTFDEVIPSLLDRSSKLNRAAVFFVDRDHFSLVVKRPKNTCTAPRSSAYRILVVLNGQKVRDAEVCAL